MQILFQPGHPKYLIEALQLIHKLNKKDAYKIALFEKQLNEIKFKNPVVFLFDSGKKKPEITTIKYFEDGYKVFAFKYSKEPMNMFDFSLTILNLWPKVLEVIKVENKPFVYTYKCGGKRLKKVIE